MVTSSIETGNAPYVSSNRIRILVDNGSYGMQNHGDVAMLIVAVKRLRLNWPNAEILVVTDRPDRLRRVIADVLPVPTYGHLFGPLHRILAGAEQKILHENPKLSLLIIKSLSKFVPKIGRNRNMADYEQIISGVDLVVASGGGYMTENFNFYAIPILDVLETGARLGKTTAMFGQGLGPFKTGSHLHSKAQAVMPLLDRIMVREAGASKGLLHDLNIPSDQVRLTGDDAIELAYNHRPERYGDGIGINIRQTHYAEVDSDVVNQLKKVLHAAARKRKTSLVPLPIAISSNEGDYRSIRELLSGFDDASDGGEGLLTPLEVIQQLNRCRIVVTGAYHAAVFALSCGIPAVCLTKSHYYVDKMAGLVAQFGDGCSIIMPDEKNFEAAVANAIEDAWDRAEEVRPSLLAAAERQIAAGQSAYQELRSVVQLRR